MIVKNTSGDLYYVTEKMFGGVLLRTMEETFNLSTYSFGEMLRHDELVVEEVVDVKLIVGNHPFFDNIKPELLAVEGKTTRTMLDLYKSGKNQNKTWLPVFVQDIYDVRWEQYRMDGLLEVVEL